MQTKTNKINANQLCAILIALLMAMRPIVRASIQTSITQNDAWISCLIGMLINSGMAIILCYIAYLNPNKSFADILKDCFGKVVTKILLILLFVFFLYKLVIIDYEMESFLYETLYTDINWELFILPVYLTFCYLATKTIRTIGRVSQFFLPFALFALVLTIAFSMPSWNFSNLLPIMDKGYSSLLKSLYYALIQSGEFLFITVFMENIITNEKNFFTKVGASTIATTLIVTFFYIVYIAVFGNLAQFVKEGLIRATQVSLHASALFKVDAFVSLMWIPIIVLESALSVYAISWCLNKIFNLKFNIGVFLTFAFIFGIRLIPQISSYELLSVFFGVVGYVMIGLELIVPVVVLIITTIKNDKRRLYEKNC